MSHIDPSHRLNVCRASAGTGKTFTLATYYIGLLLSGESYRNILAVTFTNAATAEMKERILTYLMAIARSEDPGLLPIVRTYMLRDEDVDEQTLRQRAQKAADAILQDYDNFSISTIDAFLQQLIRGMAKAVDQTSDFAIELDAEKVIINAVDTMLTDTLMNKARQTVYEYVESSIREDKSWDIRKNLIRIAKQLYKESVQLYNSSPSLGLCLDEAKIVAYKNALYARKNAAIASFKEDVDRAYAALQRGEGWAKGRSAKAAIENMYNSAYTPDKIAKKADLFRGVTAPQREAQMAEPMFAQLQQACDACREAYWQVESSLAFLNDMRLMGTLQDYIVYSLQQSNTSLLAETAATLAQALQPGDADFILEKAGIRYRHIMIDEFQDTSTLQWRVFSHLIREVLAVENQTVLIVGDAKQSIYRFRNGNWQLMMQVGKEELVGSYNSAFPTLRRNQRSRKNVVQFNLGLMQQVASQSNMPQLADTSVGHLLYDEGYPDSPITDYYRDDKHEGGYVRCRVYPYVKKPHTGDAAGLLLKELAQEALWDDVCQTVEQLLKQDMPASDILILARRNVEITDWIAYSREHAEAYPILSKTPMTSRDSFRLESCISVRVLLEGLRYIYTGSSLSLEYVRANVPLASYERFMQMETNVPLYSLAQGLVQCLLCTDGTYQGEDVAYINAFMDGLSAYIGTSGNNIGNFLQYWDDTMRKTSISTDGVSNAIRLMTIHSSKGLEGKTVIILNAGWDVEADRSGEVIWAQSIPAGKSHISFVPLNMTSALLMTGETSYKQAYINEHDAQKIDNYNLLYVAVTRAASNLYIYSLAQWPAVVKDYPTVASSLVDYLDMSAALEEVLKAYRSQSEQDADALSDAPYFAEYIVGDAPVIHEQSGAHASSAFDFAQADTVSARMVSEGKQVYFRQSQESMLYTRMGEEADQMVAQTDFGLLCHAIFSQVETQDDVPEVLARFREKGMIENDEQQMRISMLMDRAFANPQFTQWFDASWEIMREMTILTSEAQIRPDRVMVKGDKAVVLDYKFGAEKAEHIEQVKAYMQALQKMGYKEIEGWLWYAMSNRLMQVVI